MILLRPFLRENRGQALVEMAIILPVFVLLIFSVITFGLAINSKIVVSGAAREAARNYAINQSVSSAVDVAMRYMKGGITADPTYIQSHTTVKVDRDVPITGYVTVTVTYDQPTYVPGLFAFLGPNRNSFRLASSAVFKIEE